MNTGNQIILDKYIARPVAFIMNFFIRLVGKILSIDHNLNKEFRTIAICKFKGMGSIIQATPMLNAINKRFPDAEIIFVSSHSNKQLLEKVDVINTVVIVNDSGFLKLVSSCCKALMILIRKRPEVYIDLEIYSDFSTLFTAFTFSKNRIGFYLRSSTFRMGIYTHMMFFNTRVPISKVYLQLASLIGCNVEETTLFPLHKKINPSRKNSDEYIVINPNASDLRQERRWSKENFITLIQSLLQSYPYDILLIGSKEEQLYTDKIAAEINNEKVKSTAGRTTFDELVNIISNAKLMVTNDTGPMHIAFSTNIPVVCLFGPCSPEQYGINPNAHIIYKQVYCSPCVHEFTVPPCKGDNKCMQLIRPTEVFEKITDVLNNLQKPSPIKQESIFYSLDNYTIGLVKR